MNKYSSIKKANSRQVSSRKKVKVIVVVLMILALMYFFVPRVISTAAAAFWLPFDTVRVWVLQSGDSLPRYLRERHELLEEIEALKAAAAVEQGTQNTIDKLQFENEELRALVGEVPKERILARVIARPSELPYDTLMLDRGSEHGIVPQTPVFLGRDQLIGIVTKVNTQTSLVTLVTTAGFNSTAYVIGPNIYTFAEGMGGGILRVRIPQGIPLAVDDLVVLPAVAVTGVYGTVTEVVTSPTQPEQYGYVPLSIALQNLQYVSVGAEPVVPQTYEVAHEQITDLIQSLTNIDLPPGVLVTPESATSTATTTPAATSSEVSPSL